ncbi:2-amino-4-hydroxy-6-hydroxymethyldihydropteridinediphosphokinase [soil metagenome]
MTAAPEHDVVLALGSNLGDREQSIRAAVRDVAALRGVVVTGASGLVETPALKPEGVDTDAPAYLNAVITVRTALDPHVLLQQLHRIERDNGRVRDVRWGDRTLDIDIITFGNLMVASKDLTVPHPRAAERAFVLAPLLEVAPDASLPGLGRVDALLAATGESPAPYPAEPLL